MSDSLQPHDSQHTRPPCPSPTPRVYSNPCPSSRWCHPAISSSVIPFSSCPQSLPASGSFPVSQLFTWGGQSIGVSISASVPPMNTQDLSPSGWTGWISLQSKGLSRVFSIIALILKPETVPKKRKLQANIFDDYRCKISQWNISKLNPATHIQDHILWSSWIHLRITKFMKFNIHIIQHTQMNQWDTLYQQEKRQKPHDHLNRCRKKHLVKFNLHSW